MARYLKYGTPVKKYYKGACLRLRDLWDTFDDETNRVIGTIRQDGQDIIMMIYVVGVYIGVSQEIRAERTLSDMTPAI